jgi:hypothetical protein
MMEEEDQDVITILQVDGLAQFFRSEELGPIWLSCGFCKSYYGKALVGKLKAYLVDQLWLLEKPLSLTSRPHMS